MRLMGWSIVFNYADCRLDEPPGGRGAGGVPSEVTLFCAGWCRWWAIRSAAATYERSASALGGRIRRIHSKDKLRLRRITLLDRC